MAIKTENSVNEAMANGREKAAAFINVYLPTATPGRRVKVAGVPLLASNRTHAAILKQLELGEEGMERAIAAMQIEIVEVTEAEITFNV